LSFDVVASFPLTSEDGTSIAADNICCQIRENFLYYFKGAQSAPGPLAADVRAGSARTIVRRALRLTRPDSACVTEKLLRAGRLVPRLGPPGHGGVGALQAPVTGRCGHRTQRAQLPHGQQPWQPSSWRSSLEPVETRRKGALRASHVMPSGHPCPGSPPDRCAPIRRMGQVRRPGESAGTGGVKPASATFGFLLISLRIASLRDVSHSGTRPQNRRADLLNPAIYQRWRTDSLGPME
jgi:hypothetical protein